MDWWLIDVRVSGRAWIQRNTEPETSRRLQQQSVAISALGILAFILILIITLAAVNKSPSTSPQQPGVARYRYRVPAARSDCVHGYYDLGSCYYDANYKPEGQLCDNGGDLNPADHLCYYSTPAVCQYANNYINGACYNIAFRCDKLFDVDALTQSFQREKCRACFRGYPLSGFCYYKFRKLASTVLSPSLDYVCEGPYDNYLNGYCYGIQSVWLDSGAESCWHVKIRSD